jgi:aspartyl aminopeptidase
MTSKAISKATNHERFNDDLVEFLKQSPTPFHAVSNMAGLLLEQGFNRLEESQVWDIGPGKYFVVRNQSSIIAFILGTVDLATSGIRMVGAHTDSPCLKVKPIPEKHTNGYLQLGVEVYGGALLNPWFDRDLSIAGRVTHRAKDGELVNTLVDLLEPVAVIPSLAIHLDREANKNRSVNPETDIPPILLQQDENGSLTDMLHSALDNVDDILATELFFYDTNPARIIGANKDFLASARLDNLLSCYIGIRSLCDADDELTSLLICSDHEEVGSASSSGAEGSFLKDVLSRLIPETETRLRALAASMLISTDNAHGIHPNYPDKHDGNHGPVLNGGPAIKFNANQRYATNSETAGYFKKLCAIANTSCQEFVNRADMACGSTIGPITAKEIGVKTIDVGVPTFAMHSIRELAGARDASALHKVLTTFFRDPGPLGASGS